MESDKVIINVGIDKWYPKGSFRLKKSLKSNFDGKLLQWIDVFPNDNFNGKTIYCVKASAMEEALKYRYKYLLWLDCSIWATKDITPVFDLIQKHGYYAVNNGYNLAQTVSDSCLSFFGITRDEAEKIPESTSCIFGIDLTKHMALAEMFIESCKQGAADGSREHDNQSQDKRFLFHRQDQSVWSLCLHKCGLKPYDDYGSIISYNVSKGDFDPIFLNNGM